MKRLISYIISKPFHESTKESENKFIKMRVFTAWLIIVILILTSCGLDDGCSEKCNGPGLFFCPGTKEGCRAKKESMGCSKFSFNESKKACKVFDCPDNCFGSGIEIFEKEEFETDYSYVEIFKDPDSDTQLVVEWFYLEEEEEE
jgi:hypothetical protein